LANKREMDNQRWSHRTKALDDLEVGTVVAIQNRTGPNPTKWDKTGIVLENKPNSKVMIKVDGSRRVTMRNRKFVRPMEPPLRTTTRPAPARRRPTTQPTTRQELPRRTPLSSPPVQGDHVDENPAEVREGGRDERFEEVHDTEDVHYEVDVRQDVDALEVRDDAQAGERDDREHERLFEDVTEVQEREDGPTRPKRSPKPNPRYSPDDCDLNCVSGKPRTKSQRSIRRAGGPSR
jgi:hypothetical protein